MARAPKMPTKKPRTPLARFSSFEEEAAAMVVWVFEGGGSGSVAGGDGRVLGGGRLRRGAQLVVEGADVVDAAEAGEDGGLVGVLGVADADADVEVIGGPRAAADDAERLVRALVARVEVAQRGVGGR